MPSIAFHVTPIGKRSRMPPTDPLLKRRLSFRINTGALLQPGRRRRSSKADLLQFLALFGRLLTRRACNCDGHARGAICATRKNKNLCLAVVNPVGPRLRSVLDSTT